MSADFVYISASSQNGDFFPKTWRELPFSKWKYSFLHRFYEKYLSQTLISDEIRIQKCITIGAVEKSRHPIHHVLRISTIAVIIQKVQCGLECKNYSSIKPVLFMLLLVQQTQRSKCVLKRWKIRCTRFVICYAFANYMAIYMRTRDFLSLVKHDLLGVSLHSVRNKNHSSKNF